MSSFALLRTLLDALDICDDDVQLHNAILRVANDLDFIVHQ